MTKRVRLRVAYDGTAYHGWQLQPGAVTIEQVLNETLTELLGEPIQVYRSQPDRLWRPCQRKCGCFLTQATGCLRIRSALP